MEILTIILKESLRKVKGIEVALIYRFIYYWRQR